MLPPHLHLSRFAPFPFTDYPNFSWHFRFSTFSSTSLSARKKMGIKRAFCAKQLPGKAPEVDEVFLFSLCVCACFFLAATVTGISIIVCYNSRLGQNVKIYFISFARSLILLVVAQLPTATFPFCVCVCVFAYLYRLLPPCGACIKYAFVLLLLPQPSQGAVEAAVSALILIPKLRYKNAIKQKNTAWVRRTKSRQQWVKEGQCEGKGEKREKSAQSQNFDSIGWKSLAAAGPGPFLC